MTLINSLLLTALFFSCSITFFLIRKLKFQHKEELQRKDKENQFLISARDNLLRSVNHELRAPLARIKLDVEMLNDMSSKKSLNEDVLFMEGLIDELMDLEKIKVGKLSKNEINITKLIQDVVDRLNIDLESLHFDSSESIDFDCDERLLVKLVKNLLENAYKYRAQGGDVRVNLKNEDKRIVLTVMNEGANIPSEEIPFLFEPFYRAKGSKVNGESGLGLGLNICKEIAIAHNGKIQVSSKKDLGTTFKVVLAK